MGTKLIDKEVGRRINNLESIEPKEVEQLGDTTHVHKVQDNQFLVGQLNYKNEQLKDKLNLRRSTRTPKKREMFVSYAG